MSENRRLIERLGDIARHFRPSAQPDITQASAWTVAAVESVVLCVLAMIFSAWAEPRDPFGLHADFPWLWIVPAFLAMRYGTAIGVTAVITFVCFWLALPLLGWLPQAASNEFPKAYFLGGLVLVLICGQFADIWTARTRRLRGVNAYLDERLQTLTKNHFLLRLSHERLEQDLLAKPLTLRETLVHLRSLTVFRPNFDPASLPGARELMQLLAQSCQLEIAALYGVVIDKSGQPTAAPHVTPVAMLGAAGLLDGNDPLLRFCLAENKLAHVRTKEISPDERRSSRYLVCAPLLPSRGPLIGVLAVEKLPFFALNDDTLQLLSVLLSYYADGVQIGQIAQPILSAMPDCPPEMALDLVRLHRIRLEAGIDSSLVAFVFGHDEISLDVLDQIKRLKRGVDLSWEITGAKNTALITLLPLAGSAAVDGYLLRLESLIKGQFGQGLIGNKVSTHITRLGAIDPVDVLTNLVRRCAV